MNNKVKFLRGTATEYEASTKDNDTFYYTTDDEKLYLGNKEITGIEIDDTTTTAIDKTWSAKHIDETITSALANKADSSDIPTKTSELTNDSGFITSPDGGDADTFDGKHASDFTQNLGALTTGSLLDYVLTLTDSGYLFVSGSVTDTPIPGQFFFVDVRRYAAGHYAITATRFNEGGVYTNRYNNSSDMKKWYGWANAADGGNATSVGGKTITITDVDPGAGSALNTGEIVFVTEVT